MLLSQVALALRRDVEIVLDALSSEIPAILRDNLIGIYLDGSLALGDFDADSDIDFVAVIHQSLAPHEFAQLQHMHTRVAQLSSRFAFDIEGSYITAQALRSARESQPPHATLERGKDERLKMDQHDDAYWTVHRWVLRNRGITLMGAPPQTLIDDVSPHLLQDAACEILRTWQSRVNRAAQIFERRGYQSYAALSMCRVLYTLDVGGIVSKKVAAEWARENLPAQWRAVIDRAWQGRQQPDSISTARDIAETVELIRYTLTRARIIDLDT
jgi:hypothetical protein